MKPFVKGSGAWVRRAVGHAALALVALTCSAVAQPAPPAPAPEVRGTWLTTTGVDQIASGFNTENVVRQLRNVGINTIYAEAWKNGYTQFASPTLDALIGIDRTPWLGQRSLLEEVAIQAHRNNQAAIAWFEYGFASQFLGSSSDGAFLNPLSTKARQNGWLLEDRAGDYTNASNGFAWMNPAIPEVRQLLIGITLDAVRTHDLDGIQFDDRLAWPKEFGWDATTAALYQAETGRSLPASVNDANFRGWRQSKVTLFAQELSAALRAENATLHLSVAPSVAGFSDDNYNARWTDWVNQGLFDEYVPQVYRASLSEFRTALTDNLSAFEEAGGDVNDLVIGLRLNGSGGNTTMPVLQQQIIDVALAEGGELAGHSLWYGSGVADNAASLTSFYGNQRDSPFFDADWRPDPLVASLVAGQWQVVVEEAMHYRLIAEIAGRWEEIDADYFDVGTFNFTVAGATQVELLVDRRPYGSVPEPTTAAVMVFAAGLLAARRRHRR